MIDMKKAAEIAKKEMGLTAIPEFGSPLRKEFSRRVYAILTESQEKQIQMKLEGYR